MLLLANGLEVIAISCTLFITLKGKEPFMVYLFPIDLSLLPPTTVDMCQLMVITEHPLLVTLLVALLAHISCITAECIYPLSVCVCVCVCKVQPNMNKIHILYTVLVDGPV
jgi:hypothetical protein